MTAIRDWDAHPQLTSSPVVTDKSLTREQVLLWLNDRVAREAHVHVSVELEAGDRDITILEAGGKLLHWSKDANPLSLSLRPASERDDLAGYYAVGGAYFDVSHLDTYAYVSGLGATIRFEDTIEIRLADNVTLQILEQKDLPEG